METKVTADRDYELWALLEQACDATRRARDNELREFGISRMQAEILFIVKAIDGPATPAEISRWLFRKAHTVSGLLERMEKQGLVRQVKDLERKNMIRVVIAEKGEEAYQRSRELQVIRMILSCLSSEQQEDLRVYLERLRNKALEELRVKPRLAFP